MPDLRTEAAEDFAEILGEDFPTVDITPPGGDPVPIHAIQNDITRLIDPSTGEMVRGRFVFVSVSRVELAAAGVSPEVVQDDSEIPWLVDVTDVLGVSAVCKIAEIGGNKTFGLAHFTLELYNE